MEKKIKTHTHTHLHGRARGVHMYNMIMTKCNINKQGGKNADGFTFVIYFSRFHLHRTIVRTTYCIISRCTAFSSP